MIHDKKIAQSRSLMSRIVHRSVATVAPAFYHLVMNPMESIVEPNAVFSASGEFFFIGVGFAWIITLLYEPGVIAMNPLKLRIGYNNVCVGFDMPPASYVAMPVLALSVAMGCVYSWMDTQRGYLQLAAREINQASFNFTYWSNMAFCVSLSLIPLIMVMTPVANAWGHLLLFVQHIVIKTLIVSANFYEAWDHVSPRSKRWFIGCWTVSTIYPALLIVDFAYASYEFNGGMTATEFEERGPLIPWYVTMFFDLSWFAFLATTSRFLPAAPHLKCQYSLVTDEELGKLHETAERGWKKAKLLTLINKQKQGMGVGVGGGGAGATGGAGSVKAEKMLPVDAVALREESNML
jgi:hypothetical protein